MRSAPDPVALANAWLAIEALQPQVFASQEKLIDDGAPRRRRGEPKKVPARLLVPFDVESGTMPWDGPAGDRAVLGLAENEAIRWYLPIAFARLQPAVALLVKDVEPDGPEREPAGGVAVLALARFDEQGFPVPSKLLLSSFGWACGEVMAGRIGALHEFVDREPELCRKIGEALVERAADGVRVPTTKGAFIKSMTTLMAELNLPKGILERPHVAIRVVDEAEREPVDIINSFFLRDLHRVRTRLRSGGGGPLLAAYLARTTPAARRDVLADKAVLEDLVAPSRFPLARWPAPMPTRLVTLQQAAVNAAVQGAEGELLAINGPPGTGKTTLLRDVVAGLVADRADALLAFKDPCQAFSCVELVAEGGHRRKLYALDATLRRRGIVVASANNTAVRNVSAELPLAKTVAPSIDLRHFPGTADAVLGQEGRCWGLIAAVLGNRANRIGFVEDAWWHPEWGLERYLGAAAGRARPGPPARIVAAEAPPTSPQAARERWRRACKDYREVRSLVSRMQVRREQVRWAVSNGAAAQQALQDAGLAEAQALDEAAQARTTQATAAAALSGAEAALADARQLLDATTALRPSLVKRMAGLDAKWRGQQAQALDAMRRALADRDAARVEVKDAGDRVAEAARQAGQAAAALAAAREQLARLHELEARCDAICGGTQAGPVFWRKPHKAIHAASPWSDAEFEAARDALFAAAMRLHRAFIDAAAVPMKSNLGLIMDHLKGKRVPSGADVHLGDLWDSLFLVVPLVSTTFASFDRLMDGMDEAQLGCLIVDEAGQGSPQQALGALWRSRRALVIGDPLQIPPISKVPTGLLRAICTSYGDVHPDLWAAPAASIQTLADAASPLMARLGSGADSREIGMPLLVHRRCQEPMFSIANEIAYDGLMVDAVADRPSPIADALSACLPRSCWVDVESEAEKWSPAEGKAVLDLLARLVEGGVRNPDLYIISPFREVADRLRSLVVRDGILRDLDIADSKHKEWGGSHIGTVHTFQGKEAEAVLLVLGASAMRRRGSRSWAGGTPNILNVAATRARQALYVIGRHDAWSTSGVFATAARLLPVVRWPFDASSHPGQVGGVRRSNEQVETHPR